MKIINNSLFRISFPPIILLAIHVVVTKAGLYERFWWFDIPMHFVGGVLVAISITLLLQIFSQEKKIVLNSKILEFLIIISITSLFAVSWEFMEFFFDFYFSSHMQGNMTDTLKDLCMGLLGAYIVAVAVISKKRTL